MDPIKAIGVILIAAFLLDRVAAGYFFVMSYREKWRRNNPDPATVADPAERAKAERKRKLTYSIITGTLGTALIAGYLKIRILALTGLVLKDQATNLPEHPVWDTLLTGLILMGGADRLSEALKMLGGPSADKGAGASKPIEITGRLILEEPARQRAAGASGEQ